MRMVVNTHLDYKNSVNRIFFRKSHHFYFNRKEEKVPLISKSTLPMAKNPTMMKGMVSKPPPPLWTLVVSAPTKCDISDLS